MPKKYKYRKWFTFEGERFSVYGNTLDEVYEKKAKKVQELKENGKLVSGDTLLRDWAVKCVETYRVNQKEITREHYIRRINHCILEHIGDLPLKKIRPLQCQQVMNLQTGKSKTQINEVYQAMQFIFDKAVENHLIARNPAKGIEKPAGYRHARRALTPTERRYFLEVGLSHDKYIYFMLMLLCGCRPSEAAGCRRYDIRKKDGVPFLHIRGTKTEKADRRVPMPPELYEKVKDLPPDAWLAHTSKGNRLTDNRRAQLWNVFKRDLNIAMGCRTYRNALVPPYPLADDLVPYCLRHEYCTQLARDGVDVRIAQKLMGHASISMTANIYTNLQDDSLVDMAKDIYGYKGSAEGSAVIRVNTGKNRG